MVDGIRNDYQVSTFQSALADGNDGLRRALAGLDRAAAAVVATSHLWSERAAQRRLLATLDDRLLEDIGVDRAAAARESRKPFWQA